MPKIVINRCFGGFCLSEKAIDLGVVLSGNSKWGEFQWEIDRTDPILIAVVETLGEAANGAHADLAIEEVLGKYRIVEYDGTERIETPDSIQWSEA